MPVENTADKRKAAIVKKTMTFDADLISMIAISFVFE